MKNQRNNLFLICLVLFLLSGCNNFDSLNKESADEKETSPPKTLNAKMLDNIPIPLHECTKKANRITSNDESTITVNCWEDLSVLAEFYSEEFPKKGWIFANQPENSTGQTERKLVKIAFAKDNMNAVVSLLELGVDRTSVKITINK